MSDTDTPATPTSPEEQPKLEQEPEPEVTQEVEPEVVIPPEELYTEENPMKLPVELPEEFVLGVDIGSEKSVISIAKLGELSRNPYVLRSKTGDLYDATLLSITNERIFGTSANSQLTLSPKACAYDLKVLVGTDPSENERSQYPFDIDNRSPRGSGIEFDGEFFTEPTFLSFEQLLGSYINHLASFSESDLPYWEFRHKILRRRVPPSIPVEKITPTGKKIDQCVVAVPSHFSDAQLSGIQVATAIAGKKLVGFVDEGVATCLTYYSSRRQELSEAESKTPNYVENVVIVDMGEKFLRIAIAEIGHQRTHILDSASIPIGCATLQREAEKLVEDIVRKKLNYTDPFSARSKRRLRNAVTKAIKILSTVSQAMVEIDSLLQDTDVREPLTREQFESCNKSVFAEIQSFITEKIAPYHENANNLIVEVVGGGCRIPIIQQIIRNSIGVQDLHFNMDGNNSVAIGAGAFGGFLAESDSEQKFELTYAKESLKRNLQTALNYPEEALQTDIAKEVEMLEKDDQIRQHKELRNAFEQQLYQTSDDINAFSSSIPAEETSFLQQLSADETTWLLYSDEAIDASFDQLKTRLDQFNQAIAEKAPTFRKKIEEREEEKAKLQKEAEEAEANRKTIFRDKVSDPKTPKEKLEAAKKRKEQGNQFIQDVNYEDAVRRYTQAINLLAEVAGEKLQEEVQQVKLACHLNLAVGYLQLKKFTLAIENCNMALRIDETNVKAFFRRGKGYYMTKKYIEAKEDFQKAVDLDPSNTQAKKQILLCDKQMQLEKEREKKMYSKMFA